MKNTILADAAKRQKRLASWFMLFAHPSFDCEGIINLSHVGGD